MDRLSCMYTIRRRISEKLLINCFHRFRFTVRTLLFETSFHCLLTPCVSSLVSKAPYLIYLFPDPPGWPDTFTQPTDISVIWGGNTKLLCLAQRYWKPEIPWFKDGVRLTGSGLGRYYSELRWLAGSLSHSGFWLSRSCTAHNPAGDL